MVFSSQLFLFLFLPVFLASYYLAPARARSLLILLFSYGFYAWWKVEFLALLAGITVLSYACALAMDRGRDERLRYRWLFLGVTSNLLALAYFKYANFGIDSFNLILQSAGWNAVEYTRVLLPIGLSFYIFHAISYLVDIYRREAQPARNLVDFAAFIALFPHLVAGPVLRYHLLAEQFRQRTHSVENFSRGCALFMLGFCKKVLIADAVAPLADAAFGTPLPTLSDAWLGMTAYSLQLFFDFSGYTDMAIGLALMIGFVFPENFNAPYLARSITDFWKRWHMSLSNWLREYLYIALGGNRKGRTRTYINLFLTMLLGGLWHGANWTFVLWGAWHGALLVAERIWHERYGRPLLPAGLSTARTMLLVMLGWVLFRAVDVHMAAGMYAGLAGLHGCAFSPAVALQLTADRIGIMLLAVAAIYVLPRCKAYWEGLFNYLLIPLFLWAVSTLVAQNYTPFLYFQF